MAEAWGRRETILYQYRYTVSHHQNDSRIEMIGSNESHVNVSLVVRDKPLSQDRPQTTLT